MTQKKLLKNQSDKQDQHRRFIETARQLGVDENADRFEEKLRLIASVKPKLKRKPPSSG